MTTAIKRRRGTTTQHSTFTGLEGEITVDSTKDTVVVHDGSTAGGFALLREDLSNNTNVITATNTKTLTNKTVDLASNTLTGTTAQFNTALSDGDFATLTGTETLSNKTFSTNPTISSGTANGVAYLNGSKVLTTGSALQFDGNNFEAVNATSAQVAAIRGTQRIAIGADGFTNAYVGTTSAHDVSFLRGGSEQMRLTSTGLGIGTSSPVSGYKLTVSGAAVFGNSGVDGTFNTVVAYNLNGHGTDYQNLIKSSISVNLANSGMSWHLANGVGSTTEVMRLQGGNLGLGVTPSAWNTFPAFQIAGNYALSGLGLSNNMYYQSGYKYISTAAASRYEQSGGGHSWLTAPSGTAGNAISFTQAMTLDASGNLGIGTSSPQSRLNVYGSAGQGVITLSDATLGVNYGAQVKGYGTGGVGGFGEFGVIDAGTYSKAILVAQQANYLAFYTGTSPGASSERMRIDSGGNLLVGTTSAVGGAGGSGVQMRNLSGTAGQILIGKTLSGAHDAIPFYYNGSYIGGIEISNTTTSYNTSSDYRLKENIQPMQNALDVVAQLNPVRYTWKADGSDGQGFIAHELQAVVPDCVTGEKDAVDEEGNPKYQGIDTSFLIATLTKAIQEQQEQINQLTARVAQLEGV